jgi:universal stress protein E
MKSMRHILFAVKDPAGNRQPGLAKALAIAEAFDARLELFHALSSPVFAGPPPHDNESVANLEEDLLARARNRLESIAEAGRRRGAKISCTVAWDYPPHEAIVRRATRAGADLIIAAWHRGSHRRGWLMQLTDWELFRASPLPVLLVRDGARYHHPQILAAVDPLHAHAKPLDLDYRILAAAKRLARAFNGRVDAVHACDFSAMPAAGVETGNDSSVLARGGASLRRQDRAQFDKLLKRAQIPASRKHLVFGDPVTLIPEVARKTGTALVVMGAVSRSALRRVFIGNTAERVLDALPCDVLVVKPGSFVGRVRARPRGMVVVTMPVLAPGI